MAFNWSWTVGATFVGNVVQQNDAVTEFTLIFVLDLGMKLSWNDYCYVLWSLETGVPLSQRKRSTSLYQWMLEIQISSARVQMGVSTACVLVCCGVHCGFIVVKPLNISYHNATYNPQYGNCTCSSNTDMICPFCVRVWRNGNHWKHTLWYLWTHTTACTVPILVFNCSDMEKKIQHLSSNISLSLSWYVLSSATYLFNAPEIIHHHCLSAPQMVHIFL